MSKIITGTQYKGAPQSLDQIYINFLQSFDATPQMSIDDIQELFKIKVSKELEGPTGTGLDAKGQASVLTDNLTKYVNLITQVQQSLQTKRLNLNQQQKQLNKQRTGEVVYQKLLKDTGSVVSKFDKYLLKYISFIMINPKKQELLTKLSKNVQSIITTYKPALAPAPLGQEYNVFLISISGKFQNHIMIDIIQTIIENTQPIYQEFQNNSVQLTTNVPNNATKKILQNVNETLKQSSSLQTQFNKNISNWIDLLTEIIKLNSVTILATSLNKNANTHLGDIILEFQTSQQNITKLLGIANKNVSIINSNKKNSEVFVQELISEVFRWGMTIFKLYKHSVYLYGPAESAVEPTPPTLPVKASKN
jgi:hypothetical protein